MVGERQQPAVQAVIELLREPALRAAAEQVRPAHPAGEQRIAGQDEPRLGGPGAVGHEEGDAVRRMPGRGQYPEADIAEVEAVFVSNVRVREANVGGFVHEDRRTRRLGQAPSARQVIGLHVRLDDVGDAHVLLCRGFQIRLDVVLWIHHSAARCAFSQAGSWHSRSVTLTEAGRVFEDYATRLVATLAAGKQAITELDGLARGSLVVGASTTPGTYVLPALIARFRRRYPGITVELRVANSRVVEQRVQNGEVDVAIIGGHMLGPTERCVAAGIVDELQLIVPRDHPVKDAAVSRAGLGGPA